MYRRFLTASALWACTALMLPAQQPASSELPSPSSATQPPPPEPAVVDQASSEVPLPDGAEVLISGPLHEAYAEQFTIEPTPGLIITKEPPAPIEELPPEYRPDGYDIVWIPGYWGWDEERHDFIWITGIWRQAPPDRNWVPGYWAKVSDGYQWISGFWAANATAEIEYLPKPPEPLDAQPSTPAPSESHFWIPGQWSYVDNNYQWRAGYWAAGYPDWVWVPDRYVWTPGGYIYRAGYWDYLVPERGTIFCPVYWSRPVATSYRFRPLYVVRNGVNLLANLFVYPRYNHYFYGNYYSSPLLGQSLYPWVTFSQQARMYDPLFGYYQTQFRDYDYLNRITRLHNYYASNPQVQPPRTLAAQMQLVNQSNQNNRIDIDNLALQALTINTLVNDQDSPLQIVRLGQNELSRIRESLDPALQLRNVRARMETAQRTGDTNATAELNAQAGADRNRATDGSAQARSDRRWRLPQSQGGVRLGSIAIADNQPGGSAAQNATANNQANKQTGDQAGNRDGRPNGNQANEQPGRDSRDGIANRDRDKQDPAAGKTDNQGNRDANATAQNQNARDANGQPANGRDANRDNAPGRDVTGRDVTGRQPGERARDGRLGQSPENNSPNRDPQDARRDPPAGSPQNAAGRDPETLDRNLRARMQDGQNAAGPDGQNANRPGINRPGDNRPGETRPGDNRPGNNQPGNNQPDANRRDGLRPGDARPGDARPGNARPGATLPNNAVPDGLRPDNSRSDRDANRLPGANRPDVNRPDANRPDGNRPDANRANNNRPDANRPGNNLPDIGRPGGNRPNTIAPGEPNPSAPRPGNDRPARAPNAGGLNPGGLNPGGLNPGGQSPGGLNPGGLNRGAPTPGAGNAGAIQDDLRQMRELSQRQAQRRREAGNAPRAVPQAPVGGGAILGGGANPPARPGGERGAGRGNDKGNDRAADRGRGRDK